MQSCVSPATLKIASAARARAYHSITSHLRATKSAGTLMHTEKGTIIKGTLKRHSINYFAK